MFSQLFNAAAGFGNGVMVTLYRSPRALAVETECLRRLLRGLNRANSSAIYRVLVTQAQLLHHDRGLNIPVRTAQQLIRLVVIFRQVTIMKMRRARSFSLSDLVWTSTIRFP